eukprot:3656180-Prorocentrum_lima.AAC.1
MTSSLVGSEMCIRDSNIFIEEKDPSRGFHDDRSPSAAVAILGNMDHTKPVSYTHLTLPTICSV